MAFRGRADRVGAAAAAVAFGVGGGRSKSLTRSKRLSFDGSNSSSGTFSFCLFLFNRSRIFKKENFVGRFLMEEMRRNGFSSAQQFHTCFTLSCGNVARFAVGSVAVRMRFNDVPIDSFHKACSPVDHVI